jgi:hypothetical protein
MTRLDHFLFLTLVIAATCPAAAQVPDQFDLSCKGKITHRMAGKQTSPSETWTDRFRIDRSAGLYCDGACAKPNKIENAAGPVILLRRFSTGNFRYEKLIDLARMRYTRQDVRLFGIINSVDRTDAKCRLFPFSGLPRLDSESPAR